MEVLAGARVNQPFPNLSNCFIIWGSIIYLEAKYQYNAE